MDDQSQARVIELDASDGVPGDLPISGLAFLQVMEGQGDGIYLPGAKYKYGYFGLSGAAGGDIDGDGRVDVAGTTYAPAATFDFMSYRDPTWVSEYTWGRVLDYARAYVSDSTSAAGTSGPARASGARGRAGSRGRVVCPLPAARG